MKRAKRYVVLVLIALMALSLTACGKDKLVGSWQLAIDGSGGSFNDESLQMMADLGMKVVFIFRENGEFAVETHSLGLSDTQTGTWSAKDENLTMVIEFEPLYATYAIKGDTLTLNVNADALGDAASGSTLVFHKVK